MIRRPPRAKRPNTLFPYTTLFRSIIRLASPSGDALPPLTAWPDALARQVGGEIFLLPGGYEVDGREIAPFDEDRMRTAAQACRAQGIDRIAVSRAFAPINPAMEDRHAAAIRPEERRGGQACVSTV